MTEPGPRNGERDIPLIPVAKKSAEVSLPSSASVFVARLSGGVLLNGFFISPLGIPLFSKTLATLTFNVHIFAKNFESCVGI